MTEAERITRALPQGKWYGRSGSACCPAHGDKHPSLSLANGADGWLLLRCHAGCGFDAILDALRGLGLVASDGRRPETDLAELARHRAADDAQTAKREAQALACWREASPIGGTLAAAYLRARGITCDLPDSLRFHPGCWHPSGKRFPALVAFVEGSSRLAVHRTYLRADGCGKAAVEPAKAMLGAVAGGAVRIAAAEGGLVVAEGIETALSPRLRPFRPPCEDLGRALDQRHVVPVPALRRGQERDPPAETRRPGAVFWWHVDLLRCTIRPKSGGRVSARGRTMASAQQLIGLVKSHAEGDADRFYDLAMQLSAAEEQKGHMRLAEQLRQWAEAGQKVPSARQPAVTPIAMPRGGLAEVLAATYPSDRLADVILPAPIEEELSHLIEETRLREKLERRGLKPRRRLLLSGPPGTGKTLSAAALAGELHYPLFAVLLHGLITKFMGETAQKLRMVFDAVKTTRGVYLFDEIDALAATRGSENDVGEARRVLNSFLQFLDEDTGPSIIVATTNLPGILDRAVLRRFDLVLPYEMPDAAAIKLAIERRLIGFSFGRLAWKRISECGRGLSTADIVAAAEDAARRAVLRDAETISTQELVEALERRRSLQDLNTGEYDKKSASFSSTKSWQG